MKWRIRWLVMCLIVVACVGMLVLFQPERRSSESIAIGEIRSQRISAMNMIIQEYASRVSDENNRVDLGSTPSRDEAIQLLETICFEVLAELPAVSDLRGIVVAIPRASESLTCEQFRGGVLLVVVVEDDVKTIGSVSDIDEYIYARLLADGEVLDIRTRLSNCFGGWEVVSVENK